MKKLMTPSFYRFFFGFLAIISLGFVVMFLAGLFGNSSTASVEEPVVIPAGK